MELRLKDGDYLPDGRGGFQTGDGAGAVRQRSLFLLTARRGSFPFLPELGSRLYLLPREKPGNRVVLARQYAAEALRGMDGVSVTGVELAEEADGRLEVRVLLDWNGTALEAGVRV
ncbi:MAG: hypothetical protein EOM52_04865 [Clostridia bacterium]|nr:hypothetical protein [Clostridia bacterium]